MISYRTSDLLNRFREKITTPIGRVVAAAYSRRRGNQIVSLTLKFLSADAKDKSQAIKIFEDAYESLPGDIRDTYEQNPTGYHYNSNIPHDHELTLVQKGIPGGYSPNTGYVIQAIESAFENRGLVNKITDPTDEEPAEGVYMTIHCDYEILRSNKL